MCFRFFAYVIAADHKNVSADFNAIPDAPAKNSQRILWRDDLSANVDTYEFTTVTYGTASASFLATRCLKHLAEQHAHQFTRGSACVLRNFYVDDMLTGADIVDELKLIRDETIHSVKIRSIRVKQTNCPELLEIDNCDRVPVRDNTADSCILGMQWNQ